MEESKRQINPSSIVFLIIYIVIILILSYFTIINFYKIKDETKNEESIKNELVKVKSEYDSLMTTQQSLVSEITNLKNIDDNIESIKNEVFILAQQVEEKIQNKETNYKIAYLTFDDGPYYLTDSVIKTLKENKVKATFFTIGQGKETCFDNRSTSCLDTYKKIVDNGHTIANHTYSHAIFYGLYNSTDSFMKEVEKQEELIYSKTGVKTNILRFPGGSATAGTLKNGIISKLREKGYGWVDWSAQDGDGGNLTSVSQAWSNFKNSINDNIEVVLFHDYNQITYSILPDVIKYLEDRDYILLPLFYDSVMINK